MQKGYGSAPRVVAYNSKTFRLKSLEMTVVGSRSVAPNRGSVNQATLPFVKKVLKVC
jgi:hypothetical protein